MHVPFQSNVSFSSGMFQDFKFNLWRCITMAEGWKDRKQVQLYLIVYPCLLTTATKNVKRCNHVEKQFSSLVKASTFTYCIDPHTTSRHIYPRNNKAHRLTKTCTQIFMAALFLVAKKWKPPKCPSTGEWINGGVSIQWNTTRQNKRTIDAHATRMDLKIMMLP